MGIFGIKPDSIKARMILMIVPWIVGIMVVSTVLFFRISVAAEKARAYAQMSRTVSKYASELDLQMRGYQEIDRTLTTVVERSDHLTRQEILDILEQILKADSRMLGAYTIFEPDAFDGLDSSFVNAPGSDASGRFCPYWNRISGVETLDPVHDIDSSEWYRLPKKTLEPQVMEPYLYDGLWMTSFIRPIRKNDKFVGITGVDVTLRQIDALVGGIKVLNTGYAFLRNRKGVLYSFPLKEFIGRKTLEEYATEKNVAPLLRISQEKSANSQGVDEGFDPFLSRDTAFFYSTISTGNWMLILAAPIDEMLTQARRTGELVIAIGILGTLLGVVIVAVAAGAISAPIVGLRDAAQGITAGQLSVVAPVGTGEIGDLSVALNQMTTKLRESYAELRLSEAYYRSLIANSLDVLTVHDREGKIGDVTPSVGGVLGFSEHELIGKTFVELVHPDDRDRVRAEYESLLEHDHTSPLLQLRAKHKDGSWRVLETRACSRKEGGRIVGVIASSRDITERRAAEAALAEASAQYRKEQAYSRLILDTSPAFIVAIGFDGRVIMMNEAALTFLECSAEEVEDADYLETFVPAEDRAALGQVFEAIKSGKGPTVDESRIRSKSGRTCLVEWHARAGSRDAGSSSFLMGVGIDVTERKKIEDQLRESERKFRSIFELAPYAVVISDWEGRFLDMNANACTVNEYRREEVIGSTPSENPRVFRPADSERAAQLTAKLREKGLLSNEEVTVYRPSDGRRRDVLFSSTVIEYEGKPSCLSISVDITERRNLEQQLRQAQKMEAIGQLAGGVAHDFNNLLQIILGYCNMAIDSLEANSQLRSRLAMVKNAGERAADLTRQLLAFSRRQVLNMIALDLNLVVADTLTMIGRVIGEHIELKSVLGTDAMLVNADRSQLEQVIMNLAINARDAMPDGGILLVETRSVEIGEEMSKWGGEISRGRYVMLSVSDTGRGMDRQTLPQIFDPFFTTKAAGKGTGLGLSTAYGVVRQHGGAIRVYSEVGKGSRFDVYLPAVTQAAKGPDWAVEKPSKGGSETILVVEDNEEILELARSILQNSGYTTLCAKNGEEALRMFREYPGKIDLLFSDLVMPQMNGWALAAEIRKVKPEIKCLFCSGYSWNAFHDSGVKEAEGARRLEKPYTKSLLLAAIREELDKTG